MRLRLGTSKNLGKGCGIAFFSVFAVMGLAFTAFMSWALFQTARTYFWDETPCEILSSAVVEKAGNYTLDVSYRYRVDGREYTGTKFRKDEQTFGKSRDAQQALRRFPAESNAVCYVNSADPADAVLKRGDLWIGLFLIIPLIFVAVGVGGVIGIVRHKSDSQTSVSTRHLAAKNGFGPLGVALFGLVFVVIGCAVTYAMLVDPWLDTRAAQNWHEVPCVITSSRVESHSGDDSTTYSIDIRYQYEWDGAEMIGDQYNFQTGSSSSRKWKQGIVKQHPKGRKTVCFVNPADPTEAVLSRELDEDWWFGLIPCVFILAGLAVILGSRKIGNTKPVVPRRSMGTAIAAAPTTAADGSVTLKAASTPLAGFIGLTIFALIWNGIVWGILLAGDIDGFGKAFLSIFALVGILLALGAVYFLLAIFNPKPQLTASTGAIQPGGELKIDYRFTGDARRISKLTITLEGRETATYRRGTDTSTDTHFFAILPIVETTDRSAIASGTARVALPADAIHTFDAPNNKIKWCLRIHGDIAKWPDVDIEFPVTVIPAASTPGEPIADAQPVLIGEGPIRIGLRGGHANFRPGDTIHGAALWEVAQPPNLAEIRLFWHTRGKGTEDAEVVATHTFDNPAAGDTRTFSLTIPPAPFSFSGRLISVLWAVELVIEPGDHFVRAPITVGPSGDEIQLPDIPQPSRKGFRFGGQ